MKKIILLMSIILCSCEPETTEENVIENPELIASTSAVEEIEFGGMPVLAQKNEGLYIHQGDIMIPDHEEPKIYESAEAVPQHKATAKTKGLWKDGIVYYQIDPYLTRQYRVIDAIEHWEENSNVKFVEKQHSDGHIYFTTGKGCSSYVGKLGRKQPIQVGYTCSTGNTIHEIGHALGLFHEQSRSDRDKYVQIHEENIKSGYKHNFKTYVQRGNDGQELSTGLDFNSIMMYSPYSFSSNGQPTITKLDGSLFEYNRTKLSTKDIEGINKLYPKGSEPIYEDGNYYSLDGITLYRDWNRWWYFTWSYGWKEVKRSSIGFWYYV